jgi:hypothetical protein
MDNMTLCDCCRIMAANRIVKRIVLENIELRSDVEYEPIWAAKGWWSAVN